MVNIDGKNYVIEYGRHDDANEVFPMFGRCLLEKEDDGKESIRKVVVYRERLFGPFESIEEWKEGIYLYIHELSRIFWKRRRRAYLGNDDYLRLVKAEVQRISRIFRRLHKRTNYEWNIKFEKPLKEVKFIRRDFERTDSETKYAATDVWKLEYADGSRAIMFNSIGREDYPKYDGYWVL